MKKTKVLSALFIGLVGMSITAPIAAQAEEGTSEASVNVKQGETPTPTGAVSFKDITANARITFADTTLNGAEQTAAEKALGSAKVVLSDTRENLASDQLGKYSVSIKDVTEDTVAGSFLKNNLVLKLASANIAGQGDHKHTSVTVSTSEQTVFAGEYEAGITEKAVTLNPTLTIPATLTTEGDYKANLQWTLTPEV